MASRIQAVSFIPPTLPPQQTLPPQSPVSAELIDTALRRKMRADLNEVSQMLSEWRHPDRLTQEIQKWHACYSHYLDTQVGNATLYTNFIRLIQEIFIDPIRQVPLDEETWLGMDGEAYGHKSLSLYLSQLPREVHAQPPAPFREHTLARQMARWLERQGALIHIPEIEAEYAALAASGSFPTIPTLLVQQQETKAAALRARIERIRQQQLAIKQEQEKTLSSAQVFKEGILALTVQIEKETDAHLEEMKEIRQAAKSEQEALVRNLEETTKWQLQTIQEGSKMLTQRLVVLKEEKEKLNEEVQEVKQGVQQVHQVHHALQRDVNALEIAIAERNNDWAEKLAGAAVSIAVCVAVSYLLPGGASVTATDKSFLFNIKFAV